MQNENLQVLRHGDESGNGMVVKYDLPSGLEIIGLPTRNFYGGHWDLGPTWNWLVLADRPFLVDAGRYGQGASLVSLIEEYGTAPADIDFILISHGHEDHDGGLAQLVQLTDLRVKAHRVYADLILKYTELAPPDHKKDFPAKCWHCVMPESFWSENCLEYHQVLQKIQVDRIPDGQNDLLPGVTTHHLPGHSPDCLAVRLGDEALLVGDIILPDITPWPTREELFDEVAAVLPSDNRPESLFGLRRYVQSLKDLTALANQCPDILVLPAHRLYYRGQWQSITLAERVAELLEHHRLRCRAILEILSQGPKTAGEIALEHFEERLLDGFGRFMAVNEIISHSELLKASGDVREIEHHKYEALGQNGFETLI